jgi:hypothetical protein
MAVHKDGSTMVKLAGLIATGAGVAMALRTPALRLPGAGLAVAGLGLTIFGAEREIEDSQAHTKKK